MGSCNGWPVTQTMIPLPVSWEEHLPMQLPKNVWQAGNLLKEVMYMHSMRLNGAIFIILSPAKTIKANLVWKEAGRITAKWACTPNTGLLKIFSKNWIP